MTALAVLALVALAAALEQVEARPFVASWAGRLLGRVLGGWATQSPHPTCLLIEVPWLPGVGFRPAAQAWGETVLVVEGALTQRLLAHEACHVAQFRRYGSFGMWARYLAQWLLGLARHRDLYLAYWTMALEREAREAERKL